VTSEINNALAPEVVELYPLSFAQERLWFLEQLNPGQSTYNIPLLVRFRGDLNRGLLEDSIRVIISRHDTMRTRFVVRDGIPSQVIDDEGEFRLTYTDLHGLPWEEMQQKLNDWLRRAENLCTSSKLLHRYRPSFHLRPVSSKKAPRASRWRGKGRPLGVIGLEGGDVHHNGTHWRLLLISRKDRIPNRNMRTIRRLCAASASRFHRDGRLAA